MKHFSIVLAVVLVGCSGNSPYNGEEYVEQEEGATTSNEINVDNYSSCNYTASFMIVDGTILYLKESAACNGVAWDELNDPRPVDDRVNDVVDPIMKEVFHEDRENL